LPTQRFDGATIEEALAAVRASLGADARIAGAEKVRSGGLGGFFAKERVEVWVEVGEPTSTAAAAPEPASKPAPASLLDLADSVSDEEEEASAETTTFASVLKRIASDADAAVTAQTAIEPPDFQPMQPAVHIAPVAPPASAPAPAPTPAPVPAPQIPRSVGRIRSYATDASDTSQQLVRLGLPPSLLPADLSHGLHCALVDAMARLPQPPALPTGKGSVLAVVGERAAALGIARDLSDGLDLDPQDVVICGPRRRGRGAKSQTWLELACPEDAGEHRRSWRWRMHPTLVVVDAPVGRPSPWANEMLSALEPTAAWGVAEASRKLEDVAAWSEQVGGLDALAVTGTEDTVSPLTILHLGLPIAMVDGEPAAAEIWAGLLMERLAA